MRKLLHQSGTLILVLLISLTACAAPAPDPEALQATIQVAATSTLGAQLAATAEAQATEVALAAALQATLDTQATGVAGQTATAQALITPTVTPPPTLAGVVESGPPDITVLTLAEMNCRLGPSTGLAVVTTLGANQTFSVIGRDATSSWLQIETDAGPCWLANTSNVEPSGDLTLLALAPTPPEPTPTLGPTQAPGILVDRPNIVDCNGQNFIAIPIQSTGGLTFQSGEVTVTRTDTGAVVGERNSNNFFGASQFSCGGGNPSLGPGQLGWLTFQVKVPDDIELRAVITLCTETGLRGDCYKTAVFHRP
ncbi:MAG: SH3 domain-containing protein [Anaerolineae bacterium]|nr:MAG: SH3 domain-containing protein [Anaerolineae bacterium]